MHLDMIQSYLVIRENEIWTCLVGLMSRLKLLNDETIYYLRKILDPNKKALTGTAWAKSKSFRKFQICDTE